MIAQEELKKHLYYDKDTGIFTHKINKRRNKAGDIAGSFDKNCGYVSLSINHKKLAAHRMAWLYVYGEMPNVIDHQNRNRADNRIDNLRNVTQSENNRNMPINSTNKSGVIGVFWCNTTSRWCSRITVDSKLKTLGYFSEFSDAVNARKNAEVLYGFHKNHGKDI